MLAITLTSRSASQMRSVGVGRRALSLRKDTFWNLVGTGSPLAIGVIALPHILERAGIEVLGILTVVWTLIGYFSLFDLGLGRVMTQQVADRLADGRKGGETASMTRLGLLVSAFAGVLGAVVMWMLSERLGGDWLQVSSHLREDAARSIRIAAIGVPLATVTAAARGVLEGYGRFREVNLWRVALGIMNFGLPAAMVSFVDANLSLMVASLVAARLATAIGHAWLLCRHADVFSRRAAPVARAGNLADLLWAGGYMTVSNVVSPLMVVADRFVISYFLGAAVVAFYTVPFEAVFRLLLIPGALTSALFPRLAGLHALHPMEFDRLYRRSLRHIFAIMGPLCISGILLSYPALNLWLGPSFADNSWKVAAILCGGIFCNSLAQVPLAAIQARGNMRAVAGLHFSELLCYIPLLWAGVTGFGLTGAAVVWTIRAAVDLFVLLAFAAPRREGGSIVRAV